MKLVLLAAGQGTRLRPYTDDKPKCMVELAGKPLLHRQLDVIYSCGIKPQDVALVGGYLKDYLDAPGIKLFVNERFSETNMVSTLFCARPFMAPGEDLVICYTDIVYEPRVLQSLLRADSEISLSADRGWFDLWSLRMDDPLADAETFKVKAGKVTELGKQPKTYDEIEGQYIGLVRVRSDKVQAFIDFYDSLDKKNTYDGKNFDNMYLTSLIQALIENEWQVRPVFTENGWLEIDSTTDLERYSELYRNGGLKPYIDFNDIHSSHNTTKN